MCFNNCKTTILFIVEVKNYAESKFVKFILHNSYFVKINYRKLEILHTNREINFNFKDL